MPSSIESRDESPFNLSNILGIAPDLDCYCVGFARTTGKRCRLRASDIRGRAQASRILDEGSRLLESGEECIDETLEVLAPLLLCTRWHQDQAGQLVYDWSRKVEKFHERRWASARFLSRSPSPSPSPIPDHGSERARIFGATDLARSTSRVSSPRQISRTDVVERRLNERDNSSRSIRISSAPPRFSNTDQHDTIAATATTMNQPRMPSVSTMSWPSSEARLNALFARFREERRGSEMEFPGLYTNPSSSTATNHVSHGSSGLRIRNNDSEPRIFTFGSGLRPVSQMTFRAPRITASESTREQPTTVSSSRAAPARSEAETSTSPSRESSRPARNTATQPTTQSGEATRRHAEGECTICFLPLLDGNGESDERDEVERNDDPSEPDEEESEDEHESQDGYEDLVWCRKRCGNNFHRNCMDSWIHSFEDRFEEDGRQPTCPICRAEWKEEQ